MCDNIFSNIKKRKRKKHSDGFQILIFQMSSRADRPLCRSISGRFDDHRASKTFERLLSMQDLNNLEVFIPVCNIKYVAAEASA